MKQYATISNKSIYIKSKRQNHKMIISSLQESALKEDGP